MSRRQGKSFQQALKCPGRVRLRSEAGTISQWSCLRAMSGTSGKFASLFVFLLTLPNLLLAQAPRTAPVATLQPANARTEAQFQRINSVRELSDGRVLISDEGENNVFVVEMRTGTAKGIGALGGGPTEFRRAGRIWPLGGDSTAMVEANGRRWLLLDADRFVTSLPGTTPVLIATLGQRLYGTDRLGRVLVNPMSPTLASDSSPIKIVDRRTGAVEEIGRTQPVSQVGARAEVPGTRPIVSTVNFEPRDQPVMFQDGWVAIARFAPYRVDWCPPREACRRGEPLDVGGARLTPGTKRAYIALLTMMSGGREYAPIDQITGWPETAPAFVRMPWRTEPTSLAASPDGRLLVLRFPQEGETGNRYDIIDRAGKLVGRLQLDLRQQIVGFGRGSVYLSETDDDGLQRLTRHPWP